MALPTITVCGNLKRIDSKFIPSGKQVVKFQVECSEKNSKGEWQNLYISGEVWDKSAEFVMNYFKDGSSAIVTGKLVTNVYEKQDGTKVYENKFLFPNITFAPKDKEVQGQAPSHNAPNQQYTQQQPQQQMQNQQPQQSQGNQPQMNYDNDEIPF